MTHRKRPKFIYFDLGNVLLLFDHEIAARQMGELAGIPADSIRKIVFENDLQVAYETGTVSTDAFYDHFCRATGSSPDKGEVLLAASDIFTLNVPIVPVVVQLAARGMRLGILSNTCEAHWNFVNDDRFMLLRTFFPTNALSYQVNSMKPDRKIYAEAAKMAGVDPGDIFFTDDRPENVAGAIAAGFDAVQFTTVNCLVAELQARGVEINY